jgi:hypothetical protein
MTSITRAHRAAGWRTRALEAPAGQQCPNDWIVFAISAFPNPRKRIMVRLRDGQRQTWIINIIKGLDHIQRLWRML